MNVLTFRKETDMERTLKDIQYMLACLYIWYDGVGKDAYDYAEFQTLSDRYGFHIENVDEAFDIRNSHLERLHLGN